MTGPTGDAPSLSSCRRSRLGKTRMDPSFKEGGGAEEKTEKKKQQVPPSILPQQKGWSLEEGGNGAGGNLILKSIRGLKGYLLLQRCGFNTDFIFWFWPS